MRSGLQRFLDWDIPGGVVYDVPALTPECNEHERDVRADWPEDGP